MVGGSIPGETKTIAISIYDQVQSFDLASANQMSLFRFVRGYAQQGPQAERSTYDVGHPDCA